MNNTEKIMVLQGLAAMVREHRKLERAARLAKELELEKYNNDLAGKFARLLWKLRREWRL